MNLLRRLLPGIALVAGTFLFSVGLQVLAAWTGPTAAAPGADAYAPLNTGPTAQTKSGGLNITSNVGIGTASPATKLVVSNNGTQGLEFNPIGASGENAAYLQSYNRSTSNYAPLAYIANDHEFWTPSGGYSTLYISSGGNVGIGTTNPGYKLDVAGDVNTTGCFRINGGACISGGGGGTVGGSGGVNYLAKWTNSNSLANSQVYDNGTNVGIGTASPSEKLHVNGSLYVGSNWYKAGNLSSVNNAIGVWSAEGGVVSGFNSGMAVGIGQTISGYPGLGISSGATSLAAFYHDLYSNETVVEAFGARNIRLATNGATRITVNSSGNVGIGTAYPSQKLEVAGNIKAGRFYMGDNQYGTSVPGIGTDGWNVGVTTNGVFAVTNGGSGYQPVYASDYWINNAGRWASSFSDARLKKNIAPLTDVMEKLNGIQSVSFNWNDAYAALGHPNDKKQIGVIAQELETQFPELVTATSTDGYKTVNYEGLTAVLLEAVREQQKEIDSLKARLDALEKK